VAARRGEIWRVSLDPIEGHEQAGTRPALIVSADGLNASAAGLVIIVPLTRTERRLPTRVEIAPPEGGIQVRSFAMCEQIRAVSVDRLRDGPWGAPVAASVMVQVELLLRRLLGL